MIPNALVTGAEGFVGQTLCAHLSAHGWEVRGSVLRDPPPGRYFACDITDRVEVERMMTWASGVTHVFHLAALTFVPDSLQDPALAMTANLVGTIHLASAMKTHLPNARLIYVGSADAYGAPETLPVSEDHPLRPDNPDPASWTASCSRTSRGKLPSSRRETPSRCYAWEISARRGISRTYRTWCGHTSWRRCMADPVRCTTSARGSHGPFRQPWTRYFRCRRLRFASRWTRRGCVRSM
ncbi:MAG: SDR family oxidoreductase [Candidatus Hydrogenedentes bacterium]|nr:SDR family oxidoreductase [Candidatus Hydrogenedentota bacterium]